MQNTPWSVIWNGLNIFLKWIRAEITKSRKLWNKGLSAFKLKLVCVLVRWKSKHRTSTDFHLFSFKCKEFEEKQRILIELMRHFLIFKFNVEEGNELWFLLKQEGLNFRLWRDMDRFKFCDSLCLNERCLVCR